MRILLINNLFQPEPNHLKGLAFARELQRRGHEVQVLTGFPNYPGGKLYPGYTMRWTREDMLEGVPVTRVAMYASHDASTRRRILTYVSTGLSQAIHALLLRKRFDVCHVYLGPITLLWPARLLQRLRETKVVADVQDLWPESVLDSGMLNRRLASRWLERICRDAYRRADGLVVLSPGFKELLCARGIDPGHIEVVYNWCEEFASPTSTPPDFPAGILRDQAFNIVYAGNMGKLQGLDTVLEAAKLVAARGAMAHFVLIGGGVEAERIRTRVEQEQLTNVRLFARMPLPQVNAIIARADLLLIHLGRSGLSRLAVPQKVQAYLFAGRPILLAMEGEALTLFQQSGAGLTCEPQNGRAMADAILRVMGLSAAEREEMGRHGRQFYYENLRFEKGVDRIESLFLRVIHGRRPVGTAELGLGNAPGQECRSGGAAREEGHIVNSTPDAERGETGR